VLGFIAPLALPASKSSSDKRPKAMSAVTGLAALLGGVVVFGSNKSTANQLSEAMRSAEAQRAALIDRLNICLVEDAPANRIPDETDQV
jgi:hypothetical protein